MLRGLQGTGTLASRLALAMLAMLFLALFLAGAIFSRAGRRAIDREVARACYQRAGWLATELENTLKPDGSPTDRSKSLLQRAAQQMDVSLVMFYEADVPWLTAHGPSLAQALRLLEGHEDAGRRTDSGETPWEPTFDGDQDRSRYPDRNGRPVRVQEHFPFSVETPVGSRMSLRVVPLNVASVSVKRYGTGLTFLWLLLGLASMLVVGRLLHPLNALSESVTRLGRGDTSRLVTGGSVELARIARGVARLADQVQACQQESQRVLLLVAAAFREPSLRARAEIEGLDLPAIPPAARPKIDRICAEVGGLGGLADAMDLWARLEAGAVEACPTTEDLQQLVREIVASRDSADRPPVEVEFADDVDDTVEMDPSLVKVVVGHLLDNALLHGNPPVTLRMERAHTKIEITIRDHGPGIDDVDQMRQAFAPFFRAAEAGGTGLGLGLRVVRLAVEALRGGIALRNHPQGGLEARFWLPAPPIRVTEVDPSLASLGWGDGDAVEPAFKDGRLLAGSTATSAPEPAFADADRMPARPGSPLEERETSPGTAVPDAPALEERVDRQERRAAPPAAHRDTAGRDVRSMSRRGALDGHDGEAMATPVPVLRVPDSISVPWDRLLDPVEDEPEDEHVPAVAPRASEPPTEAPAAVASIPGADGGGDDPYEPF